LLPQIAGGIEVTSVHWRKSMLGGSEWLVILVIVIIVFGATKLPQLGDGLGKAIRNFKRAVNTGGEIDVTPKKPELKDGQSSEGGAKPE
jgi:sec-independent protein translocase protein TatA